MRDADNYARCHFHALSIRRMRRRLSRCLCLGLLYKLPGRFIGRSSVDMAVKRHGRYNLLIARRYHYAPAPPHLSPRQPSVHGYA